MNATRGGSEGSGVEVYDPRTGKPLTFTYQQEGNDPDNHAIHAKLPIPVPQGGVGRVLIYKTYKDPRTYMMHGDDIVWVRSLSGYRLGVLLPKGFAFISSNVAAQLTTSAAGQLKLAFANPSGQSNPVTIHARKTTATFPPRADTDMFFDDVKTLYDLEAPESGAGQGRAELQRLSQGRARSARHARTAAAAGSEGDRSRHRASRSRPRRTAPRRSSSSTCRSSTTSRARTSRSPERSGIPATRSLGDELVFDRVMYGLRNTVLLPAGWDVSALSQSGTIGIYEGRTFVSLINLNGENNYRLTLRARKRSLRMSCRFSPSRLSLSTLSPPPVGRGRVRRVRAARRTGDRRRR